MSDLPGQSQTTGNGHAPQNGGTPPPASQPALSEAEVRAVADRVYELLLADLAAERDRRGGQRR